MIFSIQDVLFSLNISDLIFMYFSSLFQGQAFTLRERQLMGIHGLLPPIIIDQETQLERVIVNFRKRPTDVDRYVYLMALYDRNERLFYRSLCEHVEEMMPIVYTPTVGQACQQYGLIYRRPRFVKTNKFIF